MIPTPPEISALPELLKPADVRRVLGISNDRVYRLFHSRDFPTTSLGGTSMCVPKAAFMRWLGYGPDQKED